MMKFVFTVAMLLLALPALAGETRLRGKTHKRGGMLYYDDDRIVTQDGFAVRDSADVMLKAGTRVELKSGTILQPGRRGKAHIVIATQITTSGAPTGDSTEETIDQPPRQRKWRLKLSKRGLRNVSLFAGWFLYWM